ncbi:MAG: 2'-5' RNA ligase family protein [Planctomycetota bacterium]|jgi:2'-5' RNA ligase
MPIAVEMYLDDASTSVIQDVWKALYESKKAPYMWDSGARPHITLAIYEGIEFTPFIRKLISFAGNLSPFDVTMNSIGIFPTDKSVVYLAPHVSEELLALQASFHETFNEVGEFPWEFYLPGHWIPHCTLAMDIPPAQVPGIVEACLKHPLRIHGTIVSLGIVKFRPIEVLGEYPLETK